MYERYEKVSSYIWMGLMILGLLILMYLGLYNHPTGDDYYYAATTKQVLKDTGSIRQMLVAAARGVADQYVCWQGTYSAMFMMHLPPNVFGESAYKLVTAVILTLYTGGVFYLFRPVLCKFLKGSGYLWCSVSAVFVLLTIQTVPFRGESFFWYNGSMYYTGYFAVTLFFFGAMCRYLLSGRKYYLPILMILAVFLAGGNYVSLLPAILITVIIAAVLMRKRSGKTWGIMIVALLMIGGLIVSVAAPGNQVRGEGSIGNMSGFKAILLAIWQSVSYLEAWIDRWWLITAIVLTPFFWHTYHKINYKFPYPVLAVGLVHGIFCSMSCPTFYAQGNTGPARAVAIVYYGFMLSTLVNYYYLLGWFYQWWQAKVTVKAAPNLPVPQILAAGVVLFLLAVQMYSGKLMECSSMQALDALVSGEAAAYEQEYQQRLAVLEDDSVKDVVFAPYEHQPAMMYVGDFTPDENNVNNVEIAKYFNKNSIKVDLTD